MKRIETLFQNKNKDFLSVYFTAGYPNLDSTKEIIQELDKANVDMIEIGIPFSDPMADGKTIQNSSVVALKNGMSLKKLFQQLCDIRSITNKPLIMMGYLNPILKYGFERFCQSCVSCGIDGLIIPDLPFDEYCKEYQTIIKKYDLSFTMLITPESSEKRIRMIDAETKGFIYMVSTCATTGVQDNFANQTIEYFTRIKNMHLINPTMIGFGISNSKTYDLANKYASGAIVGSLFIRLLGENNSIHEAVSKLIVTLKSNNK